MTKNLVTISLMVFIIVLVGILGAGVFMNQNNYQKTTIQKGATSTVSNIASDDDNNPNDEEGEDGEDGKNINNGTNTVTVPTNSAPNNVVVVSASQVAQHNSYNDCWTIISGKVYNLTNFISLHSGGPGQIIDYCGKDGTSAFNTGPHSQKAQNILNNYYVGNFGG